MYIIFSKSIVSWSKDEKRLLPWTITQNPYFIWLREVILQQTRVDQGAAYYQRFISTYPKVENLANASLDEVYKLWEGLGYYSRARNLHHTAKVISEQYQGQFPKEYSEVLQLKGIGEYTAAAIMSFAYNQPYSVLDGNVYRVLSRYFGIDIPIDSTKGKKYFKELAQQCLDKDQPAVYNQAIIDFGAIVCKPAQPLCDHCPLSSNCVAYHQGKIDLLPVKEKKLIKQHRYFNYLVLVDNEHIAIEQRTEKDIWQHLYQFPLVESTDNILQKEDLPLSDLKIKSPIRESRVYKQLLTHRVIHAKFFLVEVDGLSVFNEKQLIFKQNILQYGFPKIIREYLTEWDNFIY